MVLLYPPLVVLLFSSWKTAKETNSWNAVMQKHKSSEVKEQIQEIRIHWSEAGRDRKVWPEYTIVTEDNYPAILELLKMGSAKDVLEVKVGKEE